MGNMQKQTHYTHFLIFDNPNYLFRAPLKTSYFGSWQGVKRRKTAGYIIANEDFEAFCNKTSGQKIRF